MATLKAVSRVLHFSQHCKQGDIFKIPNGHPDQGGFSLYKVKTMGSKTSTILQLFSTKNFVNKKWKI